MMKNYLHRFLLSVGLILLVLNVLIVQSARSQNANERDIKLPEPANTELPSIYLIGDSTVRNGAGDGANGQWGWGSVLAPYFDTDKVNVVNRGIGGRSSRTYITQGYWDQQLALLKPGDVVLIQFGHNDASPVNDTLRARGVIDGIGDEKEHILNKLTKQEETVYTYGAYLRIYISNIREKGATPIICSLVPTHGEVISKEDQFAKWAEQVATTEGVLFLDLNEIIAREYEKVGQEKVQDFFVDDRVHTTREGAEFSAAIVAGSLKGLQQNPLAPYFSDKADKVAPRRNEEVKPSRLIVAGTDYSDRADVDNTFDMAGEDIFGQRFPSEYLTLTDEVTGTEIIALTTSRHSNSKLYQTHPQWTPDGKYIVFRSSRADGQAYAVSMENYEIVQVTTGDWGSNPHLGWQKNVAYFFRDEELLELDLEQLLEDSENGTVQQEPTAYTKVIATLPEGIRESGGVGLDANEERIFFASRLEEDLSAIYSIDIRSGELTKLKEVPFRANHLQANPWVSGEIMYCWETGGDAPQRMWYLSVDDKGTVNNRPIYKEKPDEWVTHEVFIDPDHIMFNVMGHLDRLQANPTGVFTMNIRSGEVERHGQTEAGGYWHSDGTKDLKWGVADTFDGSLYRLNLETGERELLTTGHRPGSRGPFTREAHSHHSISPDGKWVLFNSSMLTNSDIMLIPLHPEGL